MNLVKIRKNPNGDTRTAPKDVTFEEFVNANISHRLDVGFVMRELSRDLWAASIKHDHTKSEYENQFFDDFMSTLNYGANFTESEWYKRHIEEERHHLLSRCPDDVNLLDVIEMIVDCVCAGKTRSGEVRPLEISDDILRLAVKNTVKLIDENTIVK